MNNTPDANESPLQASAPKGQDESLVHALRRWWWFLPIDLLIVVALFIAEGVVFGLVFAVFLAGLSVAIASTEQVRTAPRNGRGLVRDSMSAVKQAARGEPVLSTRLVHTSIQGQSESHAHLAVMALTNRRIIFLPAAAPEWYTPVSYLSSTGLGSALFAYPLQEVVELELSKIKRLWKWRPEFSGPPAAELDGNLYYFQLIIDRAPWQKPESLEDVKEHYQIVEDAWKAAQAS